MRPSQDVLSSSEVWINHQMLHDIANALVILLYSSSKYLFAHFI